MRWFRLSAILWVLALPSVAAKPATHSAKSAGQNDQAAFVDRTRQAGILDRHHTRQFDNPYATIMQGYARLGAAVAVGDYNGDGFEDIFVTDSCSTCPNHLYRNNGDFT